MGLALVGTACTDLDTDINTQYTEFPDSEIARRGAYNGCYYYIRNEAWVGRNFWEGILTQGDEITCVCYGESYYYDSGRFFKGSAHLLDSDCQGIGLLGDLMAGITYTNSQIVIYGGETLKDPNVATLRAIRAFYHFWMMELYGDAPIMDHSLEEGEYYDRQPRAKVAEFVEQELLEVLEQNALPENNDLSTYGTPTRWMAEALLAKLYLNWGVYTNDINTVDNSTPNPKLDDCIKWCNDLMASGLFEVGQGYRKKFFPDNGVHIKDFIYAVPMDPATLGANYGGGAEFYRWITFHNSGLIEPQIVGDYELTGGVIGNFVMTKEAVERFCLEGDERNDMVLAENVCQFDPKTFEKTTTPVILYKDARHRKKVGQLSFTKEVKYENVSILSVGDESQYANTIQGARLFKYPPREEDYKSWGRKQANDIPVFRFADILLTKAECILRGGNDPMGQTAEELINQVRDCSSAPHVDKTKEGLNPAQGLSQMDQILLDERSRELIYEMWRRNDLIRFGQFEADWMGKSNTGLDDKATWRRLCPIPRGEMERNTNWSQNYGY